MQKLEEHCAALRAEDSNRGLCLKQALRERARDDANAFGKLYDSRAGLSIFYRYQPRPIEDRCYGKAPIRIHDSVLDRLQLRTAGYTPGNLPAPEHFQEVTTRGTNHVSTSGENSAPADNAVSNIDSVTQADSPSTDQEAAPTQGTPAGEEVSTEGYQTIRAGIDRLKNCRVALYWVFLASSVALLLGSLVRWLRPAAAIPADTYETWKTNHIVLHWLDDGLHYALPTMFDGTITYLVVEHPWRFAAVIAYALTLYAIRASLQMAMERREETARQVLLKLAKRPT